ncbi:MAG TPA: HAMP domain-containing sensor histidine kinase [Candidatus Saccharimonadales bacterium]
MDLSRYEITGRKEATEAAAKNNRRLIGIRWWYMVLVAGVASATYYVSTNDLERVILYLEIFGGGLVFNALLYGAVYLQKNNLRAQHVITVAQLTIDLVIAGIVTYVQGGVEARTTILYMFPILSSALLFRGNVVMLTAGLSGVTYIIAILLEFYIQDRPIDWLAMTVPMVFYPAMFFLMARVAMYLEYIGMMEAREKAYSSFLSLVAHQLKHPASAATTIIDAINHSDTAKIDSTTKRYIEMLKSENENQIRLIDNLLESAPQKKPAEYTESIDVVTILNRSAKRAAEANERLEDLEIMPDSLEKAMIEGDQIRLTLAFGNIFDNAFRYSEPGNKVKYHIGRKSGVVTVTIHDGGKGMDEEEVAEQFERLEITGIRGMESSGHLGGLGLGLYAASRIVNAHGGTLDIHAAEDIGTTVKITLKRSKK